MTKSTTFSSFLNKKRTAGFNDGIIAPELVSDSDQQLSTMHSNIQYVTEEEADVIRNMSGAENSITYNSDEEPYINPIYLEPGLEAIVNAPRNREIPNNGPFYAGDENSKRYSGDVSSLIKENELLKSTLKKVVAKNQLLIADRNNALEKLAEIQLDKVAKVRATQIKTIVSLMQKRGMLNNTQESFDNKFRELAGLESQALQAVKELVITTPTRVAQAQQMMQPVHGSILTEQMILIPHREQNERRPMNNRFENLPWNTTGKKK